MIKAISDQLKSLLDQEDHSNMVTIKQLQKEINFLLEQDHWKWKQIAK